MSNTIKFPEKPFPSPVDYESWGRGYTPPSEHALIHELTYEGAKVRLSSQAGGAAFWIVTKGEPFTHEDDLEIMSLYVKNEKRRLAKQKLAVTGIMCLAALSRTIRGE
ncbi:hypothetical protein [Hyphomonas sp.]|uniref:hypothetical protein n=1 Tax=Hyphomonas sp. TaxID=87 RepID=UPI00300195D8